MFEIVDEDSELLVINKPAGLVCHPTKTDAYSSLIGRVRLYLGNQAHPQLLNRLDRETSGVTLVAKDPVTAREIRRLWEQRQVQKEYLAIVHGCVRESHGVIDAPLGKDEHSRVAIKDCVRADGVPARTEYRVERRFQRRLPDPAPEFSTSNGSNQQAFAAARGGTGAFSLLRVLPRTGRKHQIRIHLAHIGHAVVGDKLYGGDEDLYLAFVERRLTPQQLLRLLLPNHALHAREVRFTRRGQPRRYVAEAEAWFQAWAASGDAEPLIQDRVG